MTDTQMLRGLLALPPTVLAGGEKRAFQAMYDDLVNGKIVNLSKKQRAWVEGAYLKHKLDKQPATTKIIPTKDKQKAVLNLGPLPKKPPGR